MKLRNKIFMVIAAMILVLAFTTVVIVRNTISETVKYDFDMRGRSIAKHLAAQSTDLILIDDVISLQNLIRSASESESDVEYIFLVTPDNQVIVHTFKDDFPVELLKINIPERIKANDMTIVKFNKETIHDFAIPILDGKVGIVRVGLGEEHLNWIINQNIIRYVLYISAFLILGIMISFFLAERIVNPLKELSFATNLIGQGNLNTRIDIRSKDEIGDLAESFNKMAIDLKRSNNKIISAKEYHDNIVRSMTNALIVVSPDSIIQTVNPASCKLLGYQERELIGKPLKMVFPDENYLLSNGDEYDLLINHGLVRNVEKIYISKEGKKIPVVFSASMMHDNEGRMIGIVCIAQDITERKRVEEIKHENEHLAYASKSKSEFLATMSHELRTPLNSIIGFSELMKQDAKIRLDKKHDHYVDNILSSGKHLLNLINDILDLSKVEAGKMELYIERMPVKETINETLVLFKEKAIKHKVELKKDIEPQLDYINADGQRFKQIFFNLLSNAIKFSKKEGGTITVSARKENGVARFSVADTGIGIRGEDMGKLFKTFEQLDSGITRNYEGTGLGLAISKKLVELHGGNITAESRFGEGSTFTFTLPITGGGANE